MEEDSTKLNTQGAAHRVKFGWCRFHLCKCLGEQSTIYACLCPTDQCRLRGALQGALEDIGEGSPILRTDNFLRIVGICYILRPLCCLFAYYL